VAIFLSVPVFVVTFYLTAVLILLILMKIGVFELIQSSDYGYSNRMVNVGVWAGGLGTASLVSWRFFRAFSRLGNRFSRRVRVEGRAIREEKEGDQNVVSNHRV